MTEDRKPKIPRRLKAVLTVLLELAVLAVAGIALYWAGVIALFLLPPAVSFSFFALEGAALIALAAAFFLRGKWRTCTLRGTGALALIAVLAVGGSIGWTVYQDSLVVRVDKTAIDTGLYLPFRSDSKIARLDHEASLRFTMEDDLPVVDGAAALFPVYAAFVNAVYPQEIGALNDARSPFQYHNTVVGYELLAEGKIDVMFAAAPDAQQEYYAEAQNVPVEFELIPLGREGFVFFVNSANPVDSLTQDQLRDIYAGKLTDWSQTGGKRAAIEAYQRPWGSGSQTGLIKFMGDAPLMEPPSEWVQSGMGGIIERVADYHNHAGALGFSYYLYASQLNGNEDIKLLAVDGTLPSAETISNGEYPLTDSFYMVVRKGEWTPELDRFIAWALSDEGQELVAASGYAPLG